MMKTRHLLSLLLTLLLPLVAAGQEVPDAGQQTPAAGAGDRVDDQDGRVGTGSNVSCEYPWC